MCWRRMNPSDLIDWVFLCHARQLWGCCALPCVRAGSGGQSLGHWHRKLQRHPWHQVPPWPGGFLDPSEKQKPWDHRVSFPKFQIKPPGVTVRQGLQSWSITQKAVTDFFNTEDDIFPVLTDDVFCSNGIKAVTPTCYFNFLCTITPYL